MLIVDIFCCNCYFIIVEDKINSFDFISSESKEKTLLKINDAKMLTYLNRKLSNNEELTYEEKDFIFEIGREIEYFGYDSDERIEKIRRKAIINEKNTIINNVFLLGYASDEMKNDYDVVDEVVKNDFEALEYASLELQNNFDMSKYDMDKTSCSGRK